MLSQPELQVTPTTGFARMVTPQWCRLGVCLGMLVLAACGRDDTTKEAAPAAPVTATPPAALSPGGPVKVIDVTAAFVTPRFRPDPIVLQVGEAVQFRLTSADTRHTLVIETLGIEIDVPQKALNETVTTKVVTPQQAGTMRIFCRIHERLAMEGTIEVRDAGPGRQ